MQATLFSFDFFMFLLRWMHIFFGVIWIGHLYYFNFVQGAFFAETDAATKSNATQKLVPRALWWFRWGAFYTMATGLLYLALEGHRAGAEIYATSWGVTILTGATMGLIMGGNVWFIIWPAQKIVIQSATQAATGGQAIPEAAARGARALVASRTNTLLSIPMLFFMAAARHLPLPVTETSNVTLYAVLTAMTLIAIEGNAIKGKTGPMTTIKGVITSGFVLTLLFFVFLFVSI